MTCTVAITDPSDPVIFWFTKNKKEFYEEGCDALAYYYLGGCDNTRTDLLICFNGYTHKNCVKHAQRLPQTFSTREEGHQVKIVVLAHVTEYFLDGKAVARCFFVVEDGPGNSGIFLAFSVYTLIGTRVKLASPSSMLKSFE